MTRPVLPFCETMITHVCNLSCHGCTNYSDYDVKGMIPWRTGKTWLEQWLQRVDILDFGIIGGEPLIHPQVEEWILGCRDLMPDSQLRFTTNGLLLMKKTHVIQTLISVGNCVLKISIHQPDQFYTQECLHYLFNAVDWQPVKQHGIYRWQGPNQVKLQINFPRTFVKSYQHSFANMMPHQSEPAAAFDICVQKTCPLLYQGRLYKCSTSGLLHKVLVDWQREHELEWQSYLQYKGISPDCSAHELDTFLTNFGCAEWICSMCPTKNELHQQIDHVSSVLTKQDWIRQNSSKASR